MNKKIESFLQDIYSLPDEKLDKEALQKNLEMLLSASPEIKADQAFKDKLNTRLNTIVDFKKGNTAVRKISYLKVLFPIFACLVLAVGVFSMVDIKLFNGDSSNIAIIQNETEIANSIDSDLQEEIGTQLNPENTDAVIQTDPKSLSIKEQILAKAAEKKAAKQKTSTENITPKELGAEESSVEDTSNKPLENEINTDTDTNQDLPSPADEAGASLFSIQLQGTPPINDTPESDLNIDNPSFEQEVLDESDSILSDLLGPLSEDILTTDIQTLSGSQQKDSDTIQDGDIAKEMFKQSCEAYGGIIDSEAEILTCIKDEIKICNQLDYENGKCSFLE
ncbi:hypothetical protein OAN96_00560 [Candidatus Gracilibacteria bacterium]|nr:hypothetical protein [Candidatus Gracilibacteria bacterium]